MKLYVMPWPLRFQVLEEARNMQVQWQNVRHPQNNRFDINIELPGK